MAYIICTQPPVPRMDALPTYKITDYPLELRDYKPFAQARLCMTPAELVMELWAFEMVPRPQSLLRVVFTTPQAQHLLVLDCHAGGTVQCEARSAQGAQPVSVISHTLCGEDLQGVYWGASIRLGRGVMEQLFGADSTDVGASLMGNIYKLSDDPEKPHKGSLYPADFANGREYALPSLAEFTIVGY